VFRDVGDNAGVRQYAARSDMFFQVRVVIGTGFPEASQFCFHSTRKQALDLPELHHSVPIPQCTWHAV